MLPSEPRSARPTPTAKPNARPQAAPQTAPNLPAIAIPMGQASVAAYYAFEDPQQEQVPAGYQQVGTVTGWVAPLGGSAELFGIWLQNQSDTTEYILALRGTVTTADYAADGNIATTSFSAFNPNNTPSPVPQVHAGFWGIYTGTGTGVPSSMQAQLFAFLSSNTVSTLYITGHSLGGSLAELFALDLAATAPSGAPTAVTITYAAPKVGLIGSWDIAYASFPATASTIRVVNQLDIVPTLPPSWLASNYTQVGLEFDVRFYYQLGTPDQQEITIRHEMENYLTVATNAQPLSPQIWDGTFTDGVYPDITDTSATPTDSDTTRAQQEQALIPHVPHAVRKAAAVAPEANVSTFTSTNCGSSIGAASGGPMYPGNALVSINGNTSLGGCIKGSGGSYVNRIWIDPYDGVIYSNKIVVNGRGPTGFNQTVNLRFIMAGGEQVTLTMRSSTLQDHSVKCRTQGLVEIVWDFV